MKDRKLTIMQYDPTLSAAITPKIEGIFDIPYKLLFLFTDDDHFKRFIEDNHGIEVASFGTITKISHIYKINYRDEIIAVAQAPLGAPAATILLEALIFNGVKKIIAVGSCGSLVDLPENTLLIPTRALRNEGTSFHYLPASDWVDINHEAIKSLENAFISSKVPWKRVKTWTTDAFYRETFSKIGLALSLGCQVVEMECAALASCSEFRDITFGQLLYTADSLKDRNSYDTRNWGIGVVSEAFDLAAQALVNLK